jgi:hypothetical protein
MSGERLAPRLASSRAVHLLLERARMLERVASQRPRARRACSWLLIASARIRAYTSTRSTTLARVRDALAPIEREHPEHLVSPAASGATMHAWPCGQVEHTVERVAVAVRVVVLGVGARPARLERLACRRREVVEREGDACFTTSLARGPLRRPRGRRVRPSALEREDHREVVGRQPGEALETPAQELFQWGVGGHARELREVARGGVELEVGCETGCAETGQRGGHEEDLARPHRNVDAPK